MTVLVSTRAVFQDQRPTWRVLNMRCQRPCICIVFVRRLTCGPYRRSGPLGDDVSILLLGLLPQAGTGPTATNCFSWILLWSLSPSRRRLLLKRLVPGTCGALTPGCAVARRRCLAAGSFAMGRSCWSRTCRICAHAPAHFRACSSRLRSRVLLCGLRSPVSAWYWLCARSAALLYWRRSEDRSYLTLRASG
jgi:hypothetical protein